MAAFAPRGTARFTYDPIKDHLVMQFDGPGATGEVSDVDHGDSLVLHLDEGSGRVMGLTVAAAGARIEELLEMLRE